MMFFCANAASAGPDESSVDIPAPTVGMAIARKTARTHRVQHVRCGWLDVAIAACTMNIGSVGDVQVCLFRPESSHGPALAVERIAQAWQATGKMPDLPCDGPFILLVIDNRRRQIAVANDRSGICALYAHSHAGQLMLATDLSAFRGHPQFVPEIDRQAIYDYVFYHCIPGPRTIYRGVRKLGPAQWLQWSGAVLDVGTYWEPVFAAHGDSEPAPQELLSALDNAVRVRSGESCGAFLSGGLDSSSVAGLLSRSAPPARTFTIGFDAPGYDESSFARIAAEHFGTRHSEYFVTPADVTTALPLIAAHYSEPFGNSSVIPTYCCARFARENGVDAMLAGDGGDELFAGNTRYVDQDVFERWARLPRFLRAAVESGYRAFPVLERLPLARKGASYIRRARMGLPDRLHSYNFLNEFSPTSIFEADWLRDVDVEEPWNIWRERYAVPVHATPLQRMLYLDWKFTLSDNDLVKVNHMCDLAGVEVRYPMLDNAVVDLACRIPSAALLRNGQLRGYYKHAFKDFLPGPVINKEKHGFGLPFGIWMRDDDGLQSLVSDALGGLARRGIFAASFLEQALRLHRENAAGYFGELLWIFTMLELWFDAHDA